MNSVSSNAVSRMSNLSIPTFVNEDVFVRAESCPLDRVSFFRVFEASANSPYGSGGNDFCYYVNRVAQDGFIHIAAFDVRRNVTYANSKIDGTWGTWVHQSSIRSVHVTVTTDSNGNGFTGYTIYGEYTPISFRPTSAEQSYPTIIVCDSSGQYWLKPFDWGNFVIKPNMTIEGDLTLLSRG